jgi:hypothetical protein
MSDPAEKDAFDEQCTIRGLLTTLLSCVELKMRVFLLLKEESEEEVLNLLKTPIKHGHYYPENAVTNYWTLEKVAQEYNKKPCDERRYSKVPCDELKSLRDCLAHGRPHLKYRDGYWYTSLVKFSQPNNGCVTAEVIDLDRSSAKKHGRWLCKQLLEVEAEIRELIVARPNLHEWLGDAECQMPRRDGRPCHQAAQGGSYCKVHLEQVLARLD